MQIGELVREGIISIKTGPFGTQLKATEYQKSGTPVLNVKNLGYGSVSKAKLDYVGSETADRLKIHLLKKGDIVFGRKGAVDRHAYIDYESDGWMQGSDCIRMRIESNTINPRFLSYYFLTNRHKAFMISMCSHGTTMASLNQKILEQIELPYPDRTYQDKVVDTLERFDKKIKVNSEINENLLQQLKAIFKHWFTDNPQLDSMFQVPLIDLCSVVTKGTTPTTLGKPFVSEGINFIKAESILDSHTIDKNKFAFIDTETNDLLKRSVICSGDIVFTIAGTLGRFALVDESVLPANTNQAVAIIRANNQKVMPEYLYSFFLGNWHNDYYTKRIQQAVQANLSLTTIKSLPIPILSDEAMKEYLGIINPIIAMTKANELEISKLEAARDTLLPRLMSGELNVSELDF